MHPAARSSSLERGDANGAHWGRRSPSSWCLAACGDCRTPSTTAPVTSAPETLVVVSRTSRLPPVSPKRPSPGSPTRPGSRSRCSPAATPGPRSTRRSSPRTRRWATCSSGSTPPSSPGRSPRSCSPPTTPTYSADVPDDLEVDPTHMVTPIDFGDVCINYDKEGLSAGRTGAPGIARRPHPARVQGHPRRRAPGHLEPWARLSARHHRRVRRGRVDGLLGRAAGQRSGGHRGVGRGLLLVVLRWARARETARWWSPMRRRPRPR